jgi:RTX calcium-binding nonapeptide repeat (4 copies)
MSNTLWTLGEPSGQGYLIALLDTLTNGNPSGIASDSHFSLSHGNNEIVFDGSFTRDVGDGHVTAGTISAFHVHQDGKLLLDATGYDTDVANFQAALAEVANANLIPLHDLLFPGPMTIEGSSGSDWLIGNKFADHLNGHGGADLLSGGNGNDVILGGKGGDEVAGGNGKDLLKGGAGSDGLYGGEGADVLIGGGGADKLSGDGGNDVMTGGKGADAFVFDLPPDHAGVDKITDFQTGLDTITLVGNVADIGGAGELGAAKFHIGEHAHDGSDRIIYNDQTGALYYDADGKGGISQVKFAMLDPGLNLSHADFSVYNVLPV